MALQLLVAGVGWRVAGLPPGVEILPWCLQLGAQFVFYFITELLVQVLSLSYLFQNCPLTRALLFREDGWQPQITVEAVESQGLGKCLGC